MIIGDAMPDAISYIRASSDEQDHSSVGLEAPRTSAQAHCHLLRPEETFDTGFCRPHARGDRCQNAGWLPVLAVSLLLAHLASGILMVQNSSFPRR
jgi:hypothetical protein